MTWLRALWRWFLGLFRRRRPWPALRFQRIDDVPD